LEEEEDIQLKKLLLNVKIKQLKSVKIKQLRNKVAVKNAAKKNIIIIYNEYL
jgi:hypothetical protein